MTPTPRRYRAFSQFLRERFGQRVARVSLDAGFTCPNVDGTLTTGGCVFCDNTSFTPSRRHHLHSIPEQIARGIAAGTWRYHAEQFLAYFQAGTNTHGPLDKLRRVFDQALAHRQMVGLIVGTRPDSLPEGVLDLLQDYARRWYVCLELGMQTIHNRSLDWMNRAHQVEVFYDAVARCQGRGLDLCVHVILGLPGESRDDMLATANVVASLPLQGVKLHNLHVIRNTPLEGMYHRGEVAMLERDEYVGLVCDFLERLPPGMVMHRLSGDAPPEYLVAPDWCLDKPTLLAAIEAELSHRDTRQGALWQPQPQVPKPARKLALPLVQG